MKLKCLNCVHFWNRKVKTEQEKVLLSLAATTRKKQQSPNFGEQTKNLLNTALERCYFVTIKQWVQKILDENAFVTVSKFWINALRFHWNFKMGTALSWKIHSSRHFPRCFPKFSPMHFVRYSPSDPFGKLFPELCPLFPFLVPPFSV